MRKRRANTQKWWKHGIYIRKGTSPPRLAGDAFLFSSFASALIQSLGTSSSRMTNPNKEDKDERKERHSGDPKTSATGTGAGTGAGGKGT